MKKIICVIFAMSIFLISCAKQENQNPNIESSNSILPNPADQMDKTDKTDEIKEPYVKLEVKEDVSTLWALAVDGNTALMSYKLDNTADTSNVIKYDIPSGSYETVGEVRDYTTMSDDKIVIDGCLYYVAQLDSEPFSTLVCIDYNNNKITYPMTFSYFPPFAFYDTLSKDSFAMFMPETCSDGSYKYHIGIYNTTTNTHKEIITEKYSSNGGVIVQDIGCGNNNIYLSCGLYENGSYTQAIREYDAGGNLLNQYIVDDLPNKLKHNEGHINDFYLMNNLCYFKTIGSSSDYLYKFENNEFKEISLPNHKTSLSLVTQKMGVDMEKFPYAYLWDNEENNLYILNLNSLNFSRWKFDLDEENMGIIADKNGNALISIYSNNHNVIPNYYYVPAKNILGNAVDVNVD